MSGLVRGDSSAQSFPLTLQDFRALIAADDFGDAKAEVAIDDHDFATGDAAPGYEEFGGFVDHLIEFDDGARHQTENIAEKHFFFTEADGGFEFDVQK